MSDYLPMPARPALAAVLDVLAEPAHRPWAELVNYSDVRLDPAGVGYGAAGMLLARWNPLSPAEAWELLATRELIPMDWVEQPRRVFVDFIASRRAQGADQRVTYESGDQVLVLPSVALAGSPRRALAPPTVAACAAFAADVPNVLAAEAIAREVAMRDHVIWWSWYNRKPKARADVPTVPELSALGYHLGLIGLQSVMLACPLGWGWRIS